MLRIIGILLLSPFIIALISLLIFSVLKLSLGALFKLAVIAAIICGVRYVFTRTGRG